MTKIVLNLKERTLEVEGEETFVKSVYEDFKNLLPGVDVAEDDAEGSEKGSGKSSSKKRSSTKSQHQDNTKKKRPGKKSTPTFVKDLDLSSKKNKTDLKAFFAEKAPKNNMEKNAVFVYFLKRVTQEHNVSVDHIYTCYKYVNEKVPGALAQSLLDTASRKGWIDTSNMNSIDIPVAGENFIEHDLPRSDD